MERINVGLVGHKFMGRAHTHAITDAPIFFDLGVDIVKKAICSNEESVVEIGKRWGWEKAIFDWKDLVNDPEILLADEPTGALDTKTSVQIMDLIRDIARDRLVIMVTHNPELADKYSTRIIQLLDGNLTSDSNPYTPTAEEREEDAKKEAAELAGETAEQKPEPSVTGTAAASLLKER